MAPRGPSCPASSGSADRSRPLRLAVIAALAVAAGSGCQRDDDKKPRRQAISVTKPAPPIRVLGEAVVTRGEKPHRLLRYRRRPAAEHRHRRVVKAEVSVIENREKHPLRSLPAVTTTAVLSWRDASSPLLSVTLETPEIAPGSPRADAQFAIEQTARYRALLAGKTATIEVSDRGLIGDVGGLADNDARRELAAALVDSIAVLPEVPVGVGAKWRIVRAIPRARTAVKHRATYTLEAIDGDRLTIGVELLTIGERQPIALPAAAGATSELLALRVMQTGKLAVDLGTPTVVASRLERDDTLHLRSTRQQKTVHDYFARSRSEVRLITE